MTVKPCTVSVLLPTRGRSHILKRSIRSLLDHAQQPEQVEYRLAFDTDDRGSFAYFSDEIAGDIDSAGSSYTCLGFDPMGYENLHQYVNQLAAGAQGRWLFFWNDDAVMETEGWDNIIADHQEFAVLRVLTHREHPYAIFPVVPKTWFEILGHLSQHQLSDAWISHIGYMMDIVETVPIHVTHDRFDLTGNNRDQTYRARRVFEGNIEDPRDFNHPDQRWRRIDDAVKLANALVAQGRDMTWFRDVVEGRQDPWAKMTDSAHDPNQQLSRIDKK